MDRATRLYRGDVVTALAYGGERIEKRVWLETDRGGVLLCSEEAYQVAVVAGKEPLYSGFPKADILAVVTRPADVASGDES